MLFLGSENDSAHHPTFLMFEPRHALHVVDAAVAFNHARGVEARGLELPCGKKTAANPTLEKQICGLWCQLQIRYAVRFMTKPKPHTACPSAHAIEVSTRV